MHADRRLCSICACSEPNHVWQEAGAKVHVALVFRWLSSQRNFYAGGARPHQHAVVFDATLQEQARERQKTRLKERRRAQGIY